MKEILYQWMFESGTYKSLPEHVAFYEALEASMECANRDEFFTEKDKSRKRRRDDQDPPHLPDSDIKAPSSSSRQNSAPHTKQPVEDVPIPDDVNVSNSEDTDTAHLPKIKTIPDWLKPVLEEDRPATPESEWVIPPNELLKLRTIRPMHLPAHIKIQMNSVLLTNQVDLVNPKGHRVVPDVSKPLPLGGPPGQNETLFCEPTVSSLSNKFDFRISLDESDDEDYTIVFDKNSFSYKIISANDLKTDSENNNEKVNIPLFSSPELVVSYFDDLDFFKYFENEFPAIVYDDALTFKLDFLTEPTLSPQHIDEFNLKDETSLSKCDEVEQNVLYFNDLFSFNISYPDNLQSDKDNDDNKINIIQSLGVEEMKTAGFGLYWAESARQIPDKGDLSAYWIGISPMGDILGTPPSFTLIRDPMLRLRHRLIACSMAGRSQAPEKVTVTDLFYLRGMDVGSVNVPYLLARYLRLFASRRKQGVMISGAQGPKRQQVAAAGALEAAEDAPVTDEGAPAIPAPVQAPQPPPPVAVPAQTMAQRLARVEEDVHEIRGELGKQREILDSMACNFSRFSTWTVVGLSQMMNQARVRYTSYADFQIPYARHTRRRTDGASTSTTQQDEQQPDP
ncbi:hypothetical protein Tco_1156932 [Tanacetum coccineum]